MRKIILSLLAWLRYRLTGVNIHSVGRFFRDRILNLKMLPKITFAMFIAAIAIFRIFSPNGTDIPAAHSLAASSEKKEAAKIESRKSPKKKSPKKHSSPEKHSSPKKHSSRGKDGEKGGSGKGRFSKDKNDVRTDADIDKVNNNDGIDRKKAFGNRQKIGYNIEEFNQMSKKELMQFTGIGKVTAGRILEYIKSNGGFKNFDELLAIKGIGPVKLKKILGEKEKN